MRIPFSVAEFLDVFARLNLAWWPAHVAAYALGAATLALALRGGARASRAVLAALAGAWAFVGAVYHLAYFSPINPVAKAFGAAFLLEAALLALAALRGTVAFRRATTLRAGVGLAIVAYALVVYPLLGAAGGHAWPRAATFGLTPCPTTIFTFGVLLLADGRVPPSLLVIPFLWSLVGASAAARLGFREDLGLVAAGVVGTALRSWPRATRAARSDG